MLNDDLNRNELNRDSLGRTDRTRMGGGMIALIVGIAVFALLFMWAPWNGPRVANAPGSTVGSSTTRPSAPMAPNTAPAPDAPAAPTPGEDQPLEANASSGLSASIFARPAAS
jgi:hypothetical protein